MQRWLATARPLTGAADHGLATCKRRLAVAKPPTRGGRPQGQHPARGSHPRARPATANPQGVVARGQPCRQQGRRRMS
ncbi:hypothetical protein B296_00054115 [Ensete ventricosum]|uniref:Uncharacterized protein n=1 Tax=Ensete ventricosum TaxID=4639 RepID=A0A426WW17_ENSVE|nr:hypothetical protein B296_00054115 [Ensete ventricosum]